MTKRAPFPWVSRTIIDQGMPGTGRPPIVMQEENRIETADGHVVAIMVNDEALPNAHAIVSLPELIDLLKRIVKATGAADLYPEDPKGNTNGCVHHDQARGKMMWRGSFLQHLEDAKTLINELERDAP